LDYSSTLKMEGIYTSETSFDFQRTTRRYILEDRNLHNDRCPASVDKMLRNFLLTAVYKFRQVTWSPLEQEI
jgi:hypothetical protein